MALKENSYLTFCFVVLFALFSFWANAGTYYSNSTDPTSVNNWWTNTNGTGSHPAGFTTSGDIFILQAGQTCATTANWTIGTGVTLQIDGTLSINTKNNLVTIDGTVIFTNASSTQVTMLGGFGGNSFVLSSGATLKTKNTNGISGTNCSLPATATKKTVILNVAANYEFNGTASQASTGLPSTVKNLNINNTAGVVVASVTIEGNLIVNSGVNFTPTGTITMSTPSSAINNSGTITFANLTIVTTPIAQSQYNASYNVAGTLTINSGKTFAPTSGTITMSSSGSAITNGGTLTFNNLTIAATPTAQSQYNASYNVAGALTINSGVTFAPSGGTITMTGTAWTSTFTGSVIFNKYTIAGTPSVQPSGNFAVAETLIVNSGVTFAPSGGTIIMSATGSGISNSGTLTFKNLTIAATPTAQSQYNASYNVAGSLTLNSGVTFAPSGGTVTMSTAASAFINNGTLTFNNLTIVATPTAQSQYTTSYSVAGSFTVNSGVYIEISLTVHLGGTINNSGTIDASNGTIEMTGSSSQTIPANTFQNNALYNLIISNTSVGGVSLGGPLDIYGSLSYSGTGMKLTTNDNLTFKSTATNTAWLGDMTGNTITGKATVERYLPSRKAWRFLSVPTNTTQTIQQTWQEGAASTGSNPVPGYGIQITGAGGTAAGFDIYTATTSMKTYNPVTNAWVGVPTTNATGIKATTGYMVFVRGDRTINAAFVAPTETTLRTKGTVYTGDQTPIAVGALQFTAIGNPYPSTIDMRNITKTGVKDFFYVWDAALAGAYGYGGYQTFSNDGSGNYVITPGGGSYGISGSTSNYIQSGQAFFVQGDTGGGSLTFKEAAKTTGSGVVSVAPPVPTPQLRANLYGVNTDGSTYIADGLLVNYDDNYSNKVDDMDAIKSANTSENLSVKEANQLLVVERRHSITGKDTIFLNLTGVSVRKYRFEFLADQLYHPGLSAWLADNYLHTSTPLYVDGTTDVDFSVTSAAASYAANRFMIVFSQLGTLPVTFTSVKAYSRDKNIEVQWTVENEMNMKQYETEKSTDGSRFTSLSITAAAVNGGHSANYLVTDTHPTDGYNYYRVKSVDINGKAAYSSIVKVMIGGGTGSQAISVYPNPVVNGIINLQLNNQPQGNYGIRLINKAGQTIRQKQIQHAGGSSTESITLDKYLPRGIYQLEVTKPDGDKSIISVIY